MSKTRSTNIECVPMLEMRSSFIRISQTNDNIEPRHEKNNILVSDLVRHKPGCTATEDGERLKISDLESRGIILSM